MKSTAAVATRCLYCGASSAWWECRCPSATEVRAGKRAKPKVLFRDGRMVIVLDAESAEKNALGFERYRKPDDVNKAPVNKPDVNTDHVNTDDDVNSPDVNKRAAYMREYMRKKRADKMDD